MAESRGAFVITQERLRQISNEGWTPQHDADHTQAELTRAAVCYAEFAIGRMVYQTNTPPSMWPWDAEWWKPSEDPIRNLVKAGALIAAEIDRLTGPIAGAGNHYRVTHEGRVEVDTNALVNAQFAAPPQTEPCRTCQIVRRGDA